MNNTKIWETAKTDLKHQMTDATFQWLSPSTFHSIAGGNGTGLDIWTIDAKTPAARDWLQARLLKTIHKALARHLPSPKFSLRFIAGDSPPPSPSAPTLNPADFINPHATTDQEFIQNINFTKLWFQKGGSGFDRLAKYWSRFWRPYLNRLNNRSFDLWQYLQVDDFRPQDAGPYWTPCKKRRIRPIARALGCSPSTIAGGYRQCSVFNAALSTGDMLPECCINHQPAQFDYTTKNDDPRCRYWQTGALEVLYREGLLSIEITGDVSRNRFYHLQIWRILPLLTSWQSDQLHEADREAHEAWLQLQSGKNFFSLDAWHTYTQHRMVFSLPSYDTGRECFDSYQPNPLLDSQESNN